MRTKWSVVMLGCVLLVGGCANLRPRRPDVNPRPALAAGDVTVESLLEPINSNSRKVESLNCDLAFVEGKSEGQVYSLNAKLSFQQPNSFRMAGSFANHAEVDIGANDQEIWFWFARAKPAAVYFCNRQDLVSEKVPTPFQPDWIMEVLGVARHDPNKYRVEFANHPEFVTLLADERMPSGHRVAKRVVIDRKSGRIRGFELFTKDTAKPVRLAEASITEYLDDPATGAFVPRVVELAWPEADTKLTMKLQPRRVQFNSITPDIASVRFQRNNFENVEAINLAQMNHTANRVDAANSRGYRAQTSRPVELAPGEPLVAPPARRDEENFHPVGARLRPVNDFGVNSQ